MKKIFVLGLILTPIIFGALRVEANDAFGTGFGLYDPYNYDQYSKVICVSFLPKVLNKTNSFFVFDYSAETGARLSKPWAVVEAGKCYDFSNGGGLYEVYLKDGNERQKFADYKAYKPTDDIPAVFPLVVDEEYGEPCTTASPTCPVAVTDLLNNLINGNSMYPSSFANHMEEGWLPTKYLFNYVVTWVGANYYYDIPHIWAIINDPILKEVAEIHGDLWGELTKELSACDNRLRIEYQIGGGVIWRLADGRDVAAPGQLSPDVLNLIGCGQVLDRFITNHQADISRIDQLSEQLIAKYPDILTIMDPYLEVDSKPLFMRLNPNWQKTAQVTSSNNTDDLIVEVVGEPTELDGPTMEKKGEMFFGSTNWLMRVYVILPLLALFGLIGFLVYSRKR